MSPSLLPALLLAFLAGGAPIALAAAPPATPAGAAIGRCVALRVAGKPKEALPHCERAIELEPGSAEAFLRRGDVRDDLGQAAAAIADYDRALALDPRLALAYNNRGVVRIGLKQYPEAIADFSRAIRLDPGRSLFLMNRGEALFLSGSRAEGCADYRRAEAMRHSELAGFDAGYLAACGRR
jgi:tetratricopeptide (TPR) repeat protein